MLLVEIHNPAGHIHGDLFYRKTPEDAGENFFYICFGQLKAVNPDNGHTVLPLHFLGGGFCIGRMGIRAVEKNGEGFINLAKLVYHPLFRFAVLLPRNIAYGAVGSDNQTYGRVLGNNLIRPYLRRHIEGYFLLIPGSEHHSGGVVFKIADGGGNDIADAVDEPDAKPRFPVKVYLHGFLRDEFRLRRHYGFPGGGLGKLVTGAVAAVLVFYIRKHEGLHKFFDKGALSGTDRTDDADIDVAGSSGGNIAVNISIFHKLSFLRKFFSSVEFMRRKFRIEQRKRRYTVLKIF